MTLEQLRIFIAVAEVQHMTRAAEALGRTQSAVSASIAALESRHGVILFDRVGRRIELTETGRRFLGEARGLLARAAQAERLLDGLGGDVSGTLHVHASQTVASYWLPPFLARLRAAHPRLAIVLRAGNTSDVAEAVRRGQADIGIVEGETEDEDLTATPVGEDALVLALAPGHALASATSVSAGDLASTPWVMREEGSGTRAAFERILTRFDLSSDRLDVLLELPSNEAMIAAVATGEAACVVSRLAAEPAHAAGRIALVALHDGDRRFTALSHRQRHPTPAADALLALMRETATSTP
ncbi:MAG: LysR family transcriptional regulator [Stappia sp.]|uniref:LysR family transcriptional regulator n=1 Tax=Stappia sp. TaxID=1870903 RepID=UPI000C41AF36|nr:LysR family transcriptional regulator [Stappia sp.]MAA99150.1 LysR family transcriptional regulator [Stappia sp.]MBM19392.1 LysR family transcriptional regulator [Stappia sp.]